METKSIGNMKIEKALGYILFFKTINYILDSLMIVLEIYFTIVRQLFKKYL